MQTWCDGIRMCYDVFQVRDGRVKYFWMRSDKSHWDFFFATRVVINTSVVKAIAQKKIPKESFQEFLLLKRDHI